MTVSEQLRDAILESGKSQYRIWKDTGIRQQILGRWLTGQRDNIRSDTLDTLAEYCGLELQPKKKTAKKRKPKAT